MVVLLAWSSCSHGCPMPRGCGLPHPHCRMVTFVALLQQVLQALRADRSCVAMQRGGGDTGCPGGVLVVAHPHPPSHARTLLSRLCPLVPTYPLAPSPSLSRPPPSPSRTFPTCVVHRQAWCWACNGGVGTHLQPGVEGTGAGAGRGELWRVGLECAGLGHMGLVWAQRGRVGGGTCEAALVGIMGSCSRTGLGCPGLVQGVAWTCCWRWRLRGGAHWALRCCMAW
jgi:hypothetical protein